MGFVVPENTWVSVTDRSCGMGDDGCIGRG